MKNKQLDLLLGAEDSQYSGEELTIFKKYIEETNVYTENSFELLESNLNYYSLRYTAPNFFSPAQLFHVNSNYLCSDEMLENQRNYHQSTQWLFDTVHPESSESVINQEKYRYIDNIDTMIKTTIEYLNQYHIQDYQTLDLLIMNGQHIFKYLPSKNYLFLWKKNSQEIYEKFCQEIFLENNNKKIDFEHALFIVPVFIPIRESLFLGEFGYRDAIINYGRIVERIQSFWNGKGNQVFFSDMFDNCMVNKCFRIDGVEKSILAILAIE